MPSYFYHIAFELYKRPSVDSPFPDLNPDVSIPRNLDIFGSLPKHHATPWTSFIAPIHQSRARPTPDQPLPLSRRLSSRSRPSQLSDSPAEASSPPLRGLGTPPTPHIRQREDQQVKKNTRHRAGHSDWRFQRISVDSVDMVENVGGKDEPALGEPSETGVPLKAHYVPSNPSTSEIGWGIIHLYRDSKPTAEGGEDTLSSSESEAGDSAEISDETASVDRDCTTLCILAVPSYMTPSDLLGWMGEATRESVSHFRLVRTSRSNRYMALLKFRDAKTATEWQKEWNGSLFNSMEPENCHVVFVKSIRFDVRDGRRDSTSFPDMTNDPFTPTKKSVTSNAPSTALTSKPAPPPTPALVELPTCPVCLERMDDTTGLATIFCNHVFHCACIQKWRGSGCPVCRYTQNDSLARMQRHASVADYSENDCSVCGSNVNLWICLICGNVGCGRYDEAHAFAHYEATSHSFAMDVVTQHIWDYIGDEYVHRLIQNKSDGKLVELPSAALESARNVSDDGMIPQAKVDNMSLEYTYLLTSQLDSQRQYFEQQVDRAVDKASKATAAAEKAAAMATKSTEQLSTIQAAYDQLARDALPQLEKDRDRQQRRAEKFEATARSLQKEWKEKEVMNESLMDRIRHLETQLQEATSKCNDLEEQNRDLSFFISGMEKLKGADEEITEGTLSVGDAPTTSKGKKKKGRS